MNYATLIHGMFAAMIFAVILLLTGCAVTWPTKAGNVTLSFSPPVELIDRAGGYLLNSPTRRDK